MITLTYSKDLPELNPAFKVNAACPGYVKSSLSNYGAVVLAIRSGPLTD